MKGSMETASNTIRFVTEQGVDVPAVNSAQMREVDRIAMEDTGPNLYQMMENAGRNLALLAIELLGERWQQAKVLVLAGSGGNGGGGICAARHLANRNVRVAVCLGEPATLQGVPAFQRKILQSTSAKEIPLDQITAQQPDLVLDALIGYGLNAAPRGHVAELIAWTTLGRAPVLALDVPSGVEATSGQTLGVFVNPRWTLTLALPKTGLLPPLTGELYLGDIGIPDQVYRRIGLKYVDPFGQHSWVRLRNGEITNDSGKPQTTRSRRTA
jgi:NAD(P)H-hydrate epimerase